MKWLTIVATLLMLVVIGLSLWAWVLIFKKQTPSRAAFAVGMGIVDLLLFVPSLWLLVR